MVVAGQHITAETQKRSRITVQPLRKRWKHGPNQARTQKSQLNHYRPLITEFSKSNRYYGLFQLTIERACLLLKFVEDSATLELFPHKSPRIRDIILLLKSQVRFRQSSLENWRAEQTIRPQRLQTHGMIITNLVAQQDVALSLQVATDSKEIAAASRRDGAVMKIIAMLGALFLPGTSIAVRSILSPKVS